jgi:hypothetical protein
MRLVSAEMDKLNMSDLVRLHVLLFVWQQGFTLP